METLMCELIDRVDAVAAALELIAQVIPWVGVPLTLAVVLNGMMRK